MRIVIAAFTLAALAGLLLLCAAKAAGGSEPAGVPFQLLAAWGRFVRSSGPTLDERAWVRKLYTDWEQAQLVLLETRREAARGGAGPLELYHAENAEAQASWELRKAIQQVIAGVDSNAKPSAAQR